MQKISSMKRLYIIGFSLALALIASACVAPLAPADQTGAESIAVTFACANDVTIDAVFDNASDNVTVTMNGETLTLPHVESGSGAKYSDGTTTFWTKGDEAFVQVNDETVIDGCVAQPQAEETGSAQTEAGAESIAVTFACANDVTIDAVFDNASDNVTVTMNGETLTLPHVESGSGAKYSDGTTTFWTKGDEAFVQVNDETVIDGCVAQ